jgi:hypothetical protein
MREMAEMMRLEVVSMRQVYGNRKICQGLLTNYLPLQISNAKVYLKSR